MRELGRRGVAQPRQRDMRHEFAPLRRQADATHLPLDVGLQIGQRLRRCSAGEDGPRLVAAEAAERIERHLEGIGADIGEHVVDIVRHAPVDIAQEAQGDVVVGRLDPAGTRQAATMQRQLGCDIGGNFQSDEQPRHERIPAKQL